MKKIYLTLLVALTVFTLKASPDIYAPTLVAPANNAQGQNPELALDWNPVTGLLGLYYEVQIDTSESFSNPVTYTTDLTNYKVTNLLFATDYFWRVRAIDNSATSDWSAVRKFTTIVTLTTKKPGTTMPTNSHPNAELGWDPVVGLTKIQYQLDTTTNFNSPLMSITTIDGKLKTTNAANLHFGLKYYVRFRGYHSIDTMDWNEARPFEVVGVLTINKPAPAATEIVPDATFEWKKIEGLLKYQIHLSQDPEMETFDSYNAAANLSKISPDTLLFGKNYFWRMVGIHATDTVYSEIRSFNTVANVTLTSPSNGATNVELQPTLTWEEMTGLITFQLDLAKNPEFVGKFTYTIDDGGSNEFKVPLHVLDSAHVYYWRVRAISSRDTSDYSDVWSFRSVTLGKEDLSKVRNGLSVYPSPAANKVNINIRSTFNGTATIEVYDLLGSRHISTTGYFNGGLYKDLQVGSLPNGVYMLSVITEGQRITSKLIIRK